MYCMFRVLLVDIFLFDLILDKNLHQTYFHCATNKDHSPISFVAHVMFYRQPDAFAAIREEMYSDVYNLLLQRVPYFQAYQLLNSPSHITSLDQTRMVWNQNVILAFGNPIVAKERTCSKCALGLNHTITDSLGRTRCRVS
jgi:hypothetical protein